jgi:hypothetical protein
MLSLLGGNDWMLDVKVYDRPIPCGIPSPSSNFVDMEFVKSSQKLLDRLVLLGKSYPSLQVPGPIIVDYISKGSIFEFAF